MNSLKTTVTLLFPLMALGSTSLLRPGPASLGNLRVLGS